MTRTRAGSLLFLAFGVYGLALSLMLPMGRWNEPGAGAFPLLVSALLTLGSAVIFVRERAKRDPATGKTLGALIREQGTPARIVAITAAFIALFDPLGYRLAATLYVFALLFWVSRYRAWVAVGLAVVIGLGSWYVFGRLFATPLPVGVLGF